MKSSKRLLRGALIGAVVLAAGACTETDKELVDNVGVTRLLLIHPGLLPQSLDGAENTIQLVEWETTTAVLVREEPDVDLLNGEDCVIVDTAALSPTLDGACSAGVVAEATDEPLEIRLRLVTTMRVERGEPLRLDPDGDTDDDGIPDDGDDSGDAFDNPCIPDGNGAFSECDDNCPLVDNAVQEYDDESERGDLCTVSVVSSGLVFRVSDADGDEVPDTIDNCIWKPNAGQDFTDSIGDECEQIAEVESIIEPDLEAAELLTVDGANSFVTVDFGDALSNCVWVTGMTGSCDLDVAKIKLCGHSSGAAALLGC